MAIYQDGKLISGSKNDVANIYLSSKGEKDGVVKEFHNIDYSYEILLHLQQMGYKVKKDENGSYTVSPKEVKTDDKISKVDFKPTKSTNTGSDLLSVMKTDSSNTTNTLNFSNLLKSKELDLKNESNYYEKKKLEFFKNHNDILLSQNMIMTEYTNAVKKQNDIFESLNKNILAVSLSTALINEKKIQKLDFELKGSETLKDSRGNKIVPVEAQAKKNAEQHILTEEENSIDYVEETLNVIEEMLHIDDVNPHDKNILESVLFEFSEKSFDKNDLLKKIENIDNNIKEDK